MHLETYIIRKIRNNHTLTYLVSTEKSSYVFTSRHDYILQSQLRVYYCIQLRQKDVLGNTHTHTDIYWNIIEWCLGNKLQWNINRRQYIFIQENASENVVCRMVSISSRPQWINQKLSPPPLHVSFEITVKSLNITESPNVNVPRLVL